MDKQRIDHFSKLTRKMFKSFGDEYFNAFTNSELMEIINESRLSERDKQIVIWRSIQDKPYEEIANELNCDVRTCYRAMFNIELKMFETCIKLFLFNK